MTFAVIDVNKKPTLWTLRFMPSSEHASSPWVQSSAPRPAMLRCLFVQSSAPKAACFKNSLRAAWSPLPTYDARKKKKKQQQKKP